MYMFRKENSGKKSLVPATINNLSKISAVVSITSNSLAIATSASISSKSLLNLGMPALSGIIAKFGVVV